MLANLNFEQISLGLQIWSNINLKNFAGSGKCGYKIQDFNKVARAANLIKLLLLYNFSLR